MEVSDNISGKRADLARLATGVDAWNSEARGFEILANVVWTEIGRAITDELGQIIFAAGRPEDFQKVRVL